MQAPLQTQLRITNETKMRVIPIVTASASPPEATAKHKKKTRITRVIPCITLSKSSPKYTTINYNWAIPCEKVREKRSTSKCGFKKN